MKKVFKVSKDFPYDVKLRLLTHCRNFLANQKVRNAIAEAENLLIVTIHDFSIGDDWAKRLLNMEEYFKPFKTGAVLVLLDIKK